MKRLFSLFSLLSAAVGAARPKQVFYGNNRADFSFIPGNVAPGLLFRKPVFSPIVGCCAINATHCGRFSCKNTWAAVDNVYLCIV